MLTDKYLKGVPTDSRGAKGGSLKSAFLTPESVEKVGALTEIAMARGQSLAQMAIAWVLRDRRVTSALIGARSVAQLDNSLDACKMLEFSSSELEAIDRHAVDLGINLWATSSNAKAI